MRFMPFNDKIRALLVILFMGSLLTCVLPSKAWAVEQGGIGGRPAHPIPGNQRSRSIFVHTLGAGEQTDEAIEVINNSPETKRVLVYGVDSQVSSGGAFACAQAADKPLSVGSWLTLAQKELTLAPGSKQTVAFTIAVPKSATPGEHNGCVVIQDTKQRAAPDSSGIVLSLRSAIRVAVRMPGDIQKGLIFAGLGLEQKGEAKLLLSSALKNNGNVSLDTQLDLRLTYLFGWAAAKVGGNFPVLAGSEGRYNFETNRPFWGGWYKLTVTAHYNDNPALSLGEGASTATLSHSKWVFITPDPLAAIIQVIVVVCLIGGITWLLCRRAVHKKAMRTAQNHTVKAHEDLHVIAKTYGMPWKRLARINKLKAPYQLKTGQRLTVTPPAKKPRKKLSPRS